MKDYYKTLGIDRNATPDQIKKAFRELAKKYHPDMNAGNRKSEEKFKEINEAYAVLSDPEKRRQYDTFGAEGFSQRFSQEDIFRNFDFQSVFGDIFGATGSGESILSQLFRGGGRGRKGGQRGVRFSFGEGGPGGSPFDGFGFGQGAGGPRPGFGSGGGPGGMNRGFDQGMGGPGFGSGAGQDAEAELAISLEEAHKGGTRRVSLRGSDGRNLELDVKIPAGIRAGKKLRLPGKGAPSPVGGPPGDLYLKIAFLPHPVFTVEGDDLVAEAAAPVSTLALGGTIQVPTLDGTPRALSVKPGTAGGARLRIRGHGLSISRDGRGDLYVVLRAILPEKLTREQKKLFEQLRETGA